MDDVTRGVLRHSPSGRILDFKNLSYYRIFRKERKNTQEILEERGLMLGNDFLTPKASRREVSKNQKINFRFQSRNSGRGKEGESGVTVTAASISKKKGCRKEAAQGRACFIATGRPEGRRRNMLGSIRRGTGGSTDQCTGRKPCEQVLLEKEKMGRFIPLSLDKGTAGERMYLRKRR